MSVPTPPSNLVRQPNRGFTTFHISEIYVPGGTGLYVPNVNDLIIDYQAGFYRCSVVDYTTGISILVPWDPPRHNDLVTQEDVLLGSGPGRASESYRAYLDTSVTPFALSLDARLHLYGSGNRYIKAFRGVDISAASGDVISRFYNQSGSYLGENIPLEIVAMEDHNNYSIQTPMVFYTLTEMDDGEVVTIVVYDDAGNTRSVNYVTVKNTSFVRTVDMSLEYITDIALECPYLSSSDPTTLEIPLNMVVANIPMMGVVTYNSGRTARMNVDGTKFSLLGTENFIATRAGQTVPIALSYSIGPGEHSYSMTPSVNNHITKQYQIRTANPDNAYKVKLFAWPYWVDAITGYRLKFYMTNLERNYIWDVTNKVTQGAGARAYNPLEYAALQRVTFMVNLNAVDSLFSPYNHVETFDINLSGPPNDSLTTFWNAGYEPNQNPAYGTNTFATVHYNAVNSYTVNVSSGATTQAQWLDRLYYRTLPLLDGFAEEVPLLPTHFYVTSGNQRVLYPIAQWGTALAMTDGPETGQNVYIEFIRRISGTDLQLSTAALPVRRV